MLLLFLITIEFFLCLTHILRLDDVIVPLEREHLVHFFNKHIF